ncbi:DUF2325 domain-containing protein [Accumulibacter sp.]|jgi:hypothetical protein|uniref:DUF2325 domain-containing protein n=1 Tax=Accumulibacter sp. TaxID=2053492 RepID=UPI002C85AC2A|nr:DUF2325 domain-containing protein [Accumulibacter sp.]HPU81220.1 DUF2325 domain-containing protein [Accumulibacter sp.]
MAALIIGGDRVAVYMNYLQRLGYATIRHWNGRKKSECHRQIPVDTSLVVILIDHVNHGLAKKTRRTANEMRVPIVFSGSGVGQLGEAMASLRA